MLSTSSPKSNRHKYTALPSNDRATGATFGGEEAAAAAAAARASPSSTSASQGSSSLSSSSASAPSSSSPPPARNSTAQHVDILFIRWKKTVAAKMKQSKLNKKRNKLLKQQTSAIDRSRPIPIIGTVFESYAPPTTTTTTTTATTNANGKGKDKELGDDNDREYTLDHRPPMSDHDFQQLVDEVSEAISLGVHPRLNAKGSSGSYFARDKLGSTLAIFKPKDEEPYGNLNPKLTKWLHRNFFSRIIPFGRACLIPQLSYLSESAASLLDRRLETFIVPATRVVPLSSSAFYYDWLDRERATRRHSPLPDKPGSFQVFLKGFKDATEFLRDHPLPGRPLSQTLDTQSHRRGRVNFFGPLRCLCGKAGASYDIDDDDDFDDGTWGSRRRSSPGHAQSNEFVWTEEMMESFREQLEKLVILDFIIRNTDRGLDNFMIKPCLCADPPTATLNASSEGDSIPRSATPGMTTAPPLAQPPMTEINARRGSHSTNSGAPSRSDTTIPRRRPHIHVAAIDNSLAFPHMHPLGFRTYTYGWLYLPLAVIGQPFTRQTREHFLPKLTSPIWWSETTLELRNEFAKDPDFKESMFRKQIAVMKGQAFNVVQSLLSEDDGPVELCRRPKKLVWDDLIEVADDQITADLIAATASSGTARSGDDSFSDSTLVQPSSPPPMPTISTPPRPVSPFLAHPLPANALNPDERRIAETVTTTAETTLLRPVPLKRVSSSLGPSPSIAISLPPPTKSYGHAKSSSISSVLSSIPTENHSKFRGVDAVEHLDRLEVNAGLVVERDEDEEDSENDDEDDATNEGDAWGIRSENDLPRPSLSVWRNSFEGTLLAGKGSKAKNGDREGGSGRARSGSLDAGSYFATQRGSGAASRPNTGRVYSGGRYSIDRQGREGSEALLERDEDEDGEEEVAKKLVVVERLQVLRERPRAFFWC